MSERCPFLTDLWRDLSGLSEASPPEPAPSLEELRKTEWSPQFEKLMRNRLVMGALRYGRLNEPGKPKYNRVSSCEYRLMQYRYTGNLEHLVDAANLCLMEYEEGEHPKRHFRAGDDTKHTDKKPHS